MLRLIPRGTLCACMLISSCLYGQKLALGVVGGGSLTDSFKTASTPFGSVPGVPGMVLPGTLYHSPSKDYVLGAMVELQLSPHWSVEVDGLYRKLHFTTKVSGLKAGNREC